MPFRRTLTALIFFGMTVGGDAQVPAAGHASHRVAEFTTSHAAAAFEQFKALAGKWESVGGASKAHATYEVIGNGSAVVERYEDDALGPRMRMVTVFHLDGARLLLTHYCMAGNQPRLQAQGVGPDGEVSFRFLDATGLDSAMAGHMRNATFRFVSRNRLSTRWEFFEGGALKFDEEVDWIRVQ